MSETTSFVGGAAVAALAAFVLMRGGVNANNSPVAVSPATAPTAAPSPNVTMTPTAVVPAQTLYAYEQQNQAQKQALQQLQAIVDRQKVESDKLKEYIQRQHLEMEMLKAQAKANPSPSPQGASAAQISGADQPANPLFLGIAWALGGVMLSFGGGLVLIMMFAWFVRQQQRNARSQDYYQSRAVYRLPPATGHYVQPPIRVVPRRYREIEEEL